MKLVSTGEQRLTTDDLEGLMARYGGRIERDLSTGRYWLRGAFLPGAGRVADIGPANLAEVA